MALKRARASSYVDRLLEDKEIELDKPLCGPRPLRRYDTKLLVRIMHHHEKDVTQRLVVAASSLRPTCGSRALDIGKLPYGDRGF